MYSNKNLEILIVEDNKGDFILIKEYLISANPGFQIVHAGSLKEALKKLSAEVYDAILLDLSLPDSEGLETIKTIREKVKKTPVIVLTGSEKEELSIDALKQGAQDFIPKNGLDSNIITRSIRYSIERKKAEDRATQAALEWQTTFNAVNDAVMLLDKEQRILQYNNAAKNTFNIKENCEGKYCWEIVHCTEEPLPDCPVELAVEKRRRISSDMQVADKWFQVTCDPVFDEAGQHTSAVLIMRDITERKLADEALHKIEERYRILFDMSPSGIMLEDLNGNILDFNEAYRNQTGYSRKELSGKNVRKIVPPEIRDSVSLHIEETASGKIFERNVSTLRKDGTIRLIELRECMVTLPDGEKGILVVTNDISERKQAEDEIISNNNLLTEINKYALEITQVNPGAVYRFISDKISAFSGASLAIINLYDEENCWLICKYSSLSQKDNNFIVKLIGKNIIGFRTRVTAKKYAEIISSTIGYADTLTEVTFGEISSATGKAIQKATGFEKFIGIALMHDEKLIGTILLAFKKDVKLIKENQLLAFAGITANAIARANAEKALRESEEIFRHFMEYSPIYVFFKDENIRTLKLSRNYEAMLGKPMEELIGKSMNDLYPPEIAKKMIADDMSVLNEGKEVIADEEFGGRFFTTIKFPIIIEGKPRFIAGYTIDITERKKAEDELRESKKHLQQKVLKRTEDLDKANLLLQKELDEKEKILNIEKELNMLKSRFISVVSHEFRTPLTGIQSSVQLIEFYGHKWDEEKKQKHFKNIYKSVRYTNMLLDDVSFIGKDELGKIKLNISPAYIDGICAQTMSDVQALYGDKIKINFSCTPPVINAMTDEAVIRHILNNLLTNAMKYSKETGDIDFTVKIEDENIVFKITDHGIGISENDKKYIFDTFYRASNVEAIKGTGLGLSIVKRCVDMLNGTVDIESELNIGTSVTVKAPFVAAGK